MTSQPKTTEPAVGSRHAAYDERVSGAAQHDDDAPHGTSLLPRDLTEHQLAAAPVLASIDSLLIEELSEAEDDAFAPAISL